MVTHVASTIAKKIEETWLTLFLSFQKEQLFHLFPFVLEIINTWQTITTIDFNHILLKRICSHHDTSIKWKMTSIQITISSPNQLKFQVQIKTLVSMTLQWNKWWWTSSLCKCKCTTNKLINCKRKLYIINNKCRSWLMVPNKVILPCES